jgi:hypothetical protein
MLILGAAVGAIALAANLAATTAMGLAVDVRALVAGPAIAVGLALVAGLVPAVLAARGPTAAIIHTSQPVRPSHIPSRVTAFAARDMLRTRKAETALGLVAIAIGSALLGSIIIVEVGFAGQLDTTILGTYVGTQVRPFHVVLAVLTLVIGAFAGGEVVTLGYLERAPEFAALRCLGWPRRAIVTIVLTQAFMIGLLGGLSGALVIGLAALLLDASAGTIVVAVAIGSSAAVAAALVGILGTVAMVFRAGPADALRGE